jgi:hypothetical protein
MKWEKRNHMRIKLFERELLPERGNIINTSRTHAFDNALQK